MVKYVLAFISIVSPNLLIKERNTLIFSTAFIPLSGLYKYAVYIHLHACHLVHHAYR